MNSFTYLDGRVTQYVGDCFEALAAMEPDSVDCVVCSPPYWGLRSYIKDGDPLKPLEIGLEPTLGEHLDVMVSVFEAVKRVLKPSGTCWINYGDCYATTPNGRSAADTKAAGNDDRTFRDKPFSTIGGTLKAKDLAMVPNRLAIALQEAGWWVRSEIVWAKSNPMPESIRDRPATSHEKIFMLTKSARYFYDREAVRQRGVEEDRKPVVGGWAHGEGSHDNVSHSKRSRADRERAKQAAIASSSAEAGGTRNRRVAGFNDRWDAKEAAGRARDQAGAALPPNSRPHSLGEFEAENARIHDGRNLRNYEPAPVEVWNFATQPFPDAHFATFPPELAERCILAGCPRGGIVLDPFGGSGTTALVALRHGRRGALIELNPEYAEMARARIEAEWRVPRKPAVVDMGPLFSGDAA